MQFQFDQTLVLENEVVRLRPLLTDDIDKLLPFSINEPELWTYSLVSGGGGKENLKVYFDVAFEGKKNKNHYPFIVYDKRTGEYAGSTRFYDFSFAHDTVCIGYTWYGKKFQRTGLNRHCKKLLLEYAFEKMGAKRVEFRADSKNEKSISSMKKIGCVEEGILRSNFYKSQNERRDSIILSILYIEWSLIKEKLSLLLSP